LQATLHGKAHEKGTDAFSMPTQITGEATHPKARDGIGREGTGIVGLEFGKADLCWS
jgi:hypothetical protein